MTARLVAMNRALPRPQPARKPTMPPIEFDVSASAAKHDDEDQADGQCGLGADAAGYPADHQHRDRGHDQIAGEQQRHLARRGVQAAGQCGQDRIDEPDAHERHDTGERHGPDGTRLLERARGRPK
jgi:hypothetical protein